MATVVFHGLVITRIVRAVVTIPAVAVAPIPAVLLLTRVAIMSAIVVKQLPVVRAIAALVLEALVRQTSIAATPLLWERATGRTARAGAHGIAADAQAVAPRQTPRVHQPCIIVIPPPFPAVIPLAQMDVPMMVRDVLLGV